MFRQSAYSWLAGYEDLNHVTRLASDPTFKLMGSEKVWERVVALTSASHWFEADLGTTVSGEAGWKRETGQASQRNG